MMGLEIRTFSPEQVHRSHESESIDAGSDTDALEH
jgi:hypothetical protein